MQNKALRKILGAFKTSSVKVMQLEANILSARLRLSRKNQNYALRIAHIELLNLIGNRFPNTFSLKYQNNESNLDTNPKWAKWDVKETKTLKHPTQLVRILHSIEKWVQNTTELQESSEMIEPWKKNQLVIQIDETKEMAIKNHYKTIKNYSFKNKIDLVFYIDGSKINNNAAAAAILVTLKTQLIN